MPKKVLNSNEETKLSRFNCYSTTTTATMPVTQKLERDFLEAISEEMNSSQNRANCTHHGPFIFHCNEHRFRLKYSKKKSGENLWPNKGIFQNISW